MNAGILRRSISLKNREVATTEISISDSNCLAATARELSFTVAFAEPDECPQSPDTNLATIETAGTLGSETNALQVSQILTNKSSVNAWVREEQVVAGDWAAKFESASTEISQPDPGVQRLRIVSAAAGASSLSGLQVAEFYEVYEGYPVIRKWVEISNRGKHWIRLSHLVIDDLALADTFCNQTPLTPAERGAGSSVVAFGAADGARGFIAVSEIPSALRETRPDGGMGYSSDLFEWVLGPGETFTSEPVFLFAYAGAVEKTVSGISTPRDRAVEGTYMDFLRRRVGVAADQDPIRAPQWCSWSNFGWAIDDAIVREQAAIAARCGFALMLLDSGWQRDNLGVEPDIKKFPDFKATCNYVHSLGLDLGLWVSCFRSRDSADLQKMPEMRSIPLIKRDKGFGMSFASPWRFFYAKDLAQTSRRYGVNFFKQDYTDIKFGDFAPGHDSRTLKESYLRGLRGLLEAQDLLRAAAPGITTQITHEIYWGTPGVPCDVAVLKHADTYHIPPNDYSGVGNTKQRVSTNWTYDVAQLHQQLIAGCFNARQRFFAHRGLSLYAIEYYGAATVNFRGSLTPEIQDRQICSWLMGAPAVFAGDLASLTEENIQCYRARFDLLRRLEKDYGIYRHFQFSGVPEPTDSDWHWWGKLDADGAGAVVVIRGKEGKPSRSINIPWVKADYEYDVTRCFSKKYLGRFKGSELQAGRLQLALPPIGQEILEIKKVH